MVVADFGAMEIEATCRNRHTSDIEHLRGLVKVGEAARLTRPVLAALDEEGRRTSDLTDVQGLRGLSRNSVLERLQAMGEAVDSDDDDDSSPICATPFHTGEGAHERPTFRSRENSVDLLYEDKERRSTLVESIASTRSGSEYLSHTPPSASPTLGYAVAPTPDHGGVYCPPLEPWRHGHEVRMPFPVDALATPPLAPATPPLVQVPPPEMVQQASNFAHLQLAQEQLQREMAQEVQKLQRMQMQLQQMQVQQMQFQAHSPVAPVQMPVIQVLMPQVPMPQAPAEARSPEPPSRAPRKHRRENRGQDRELRDDVTLMLRNIPNRYTPAELLADLPAYRAFIDFFYLPTDFRNNCNLGFAFLNFTSGAAAAQFKAEYEGKKLPRFECSQKECVVETSRVQGFSSNVDKFRNSSVMGVLDEEARPMVFRDGVRVAFPTPTVAELPAPGERRRRRNPLQK
jgi:hypothetical protein